MFLKNELLRCVDPEDCSAQGLPTLHTGQVYRVEAIEHGHVRVSGIDRLYHAGRFVPVRPLGRALEVFPCRVGERECSGTLLGTHRTTGRRIVVHSQPEGLLFDTDDCYDLGNALNALEIWLQAQKGAERPISF